jgi:hypothetical protein
MEMAGERRPVKLVVGKICMKKIAAGGVIFEAHITAQKQTTDQL